MKCEDPENFNFLFCFVYFSCFAGYSDLNFRCFSTKNAKYIATWKTTLRGAKFCDFPHLAMFKTLFLWLLFAVEPKSGIRMLLNLLLLDIIGPKNATLFIRDQLQGIITSQPTAPPPPPQKLILLSIFLNDIQLNSKLCILKNCIHLMFTFSSGRILSALCGVLNSMHANNVQQYGPGSTKLHF